jgi:cytochrome c6
VLLIKSVVAGAFAILFATGAAAQTATDGATLFAQNCSACHQKAGEGVPGAFPRLAGNTFVQGPPSVVAGTLLKGRGGMPSFSDDLTDAQIATVLTYVRSSWGNHAPPVTTETVASVRAGKAVDDKSVLPAH